MKPFTMVHHGSPWFTKIILALDVDSVKKAEYFVDKLYPKIKLFKVGLQLFTAAGPSIIERIHKKGAAVFLDLKFFDIPNTVSNAVIQAARLKVEMLTLHISGGKEMILAAVKAVKKESSNIGRKPPLLIGVTVLTSQKTGFKEVLRLSKLGLGCGLDGVVCSVGEAEQLRRQIKKKFFIVTPGIRPKGAISYDQKRIATVEEAVCSGSNFLVIGRPILEAKEPLVVVEEMLKEISESEGICQKRSKT